MKINEIRTKLKEGEFDEKLLELCCEKNRLKFENITIFLLK